MDTKCIAIIPARSGSKRIPGKNIKSFLGKPIIAYSIEAALASNLFDEVMVSTDDEGIALIAAAYGAKVPFKRSSGTSGDHATTMDVIYEVLDRYAEAGIIFKFACCIYATSPLTQIIHLQDGFKKLDKNGFACVFPVTAFGYPVWRGLVTDDNGTSKMLWPEHINTRSQDLTKVYHDAGQWYWFDTTQIRNWEWPNQSGTIVLPEDQVQDIDTLTDWRLAEIKYKLAEEMNLEDMN
jgi:pseudaminic acid cytidylyltransferase